MTKKWEKFEEDCEAFLNKKFGEYAFFEKKGSEDSTKSDILVTTKSGKNFYVEAKDTPAQCGQFVLFPNSETRLFEYGDKNTNPINEYSEKIMKHMNSKFDIFKEAGTKGEPIEFRNDSEIFSKWIIQAYKKKDVRYFITKDFTIFPIDKFLDFFDVTASYRTKRSGSADVGKMSFQEIIDYITSNDYAINKYRTCENKLFVVSPYELHNKRFTLDGKTYMFSQRNQEYEIRKLSKTDNANVIFAVKYKSGSKGMTDEEFIACLS